MRTHTWSLSTGAPPRRILCADDASEPSARALELSEDLAQRWKAALRTLALPELECAETVSRVSSRALDWRTDLIVVGDRGRLQPVAEALVRLAPCSVLVVAGPPPAIPSHPTIRHILCPMEFSDISQRALEHALALAELYDARLTLLHALEWFPDEQPLASARATLPELGVDLVEEACERMRLAVPKWARCPREELAAPGRPGARILEAARTRGVDLIVLGVHARRAIDRRLSGSTTALVLRGAGCPILAVRPEAQPETAATGATRSPDPQEWPSAEALSGAREA